MAKEIKALTTLRAAAAALVFFYHFVYLSDPHPAQNVFPAVIQNGFVGVSLFFVLSGFLITLRYYHDVEARTFQWGQYVRRRIAHIYPVYLFVLAVIALSGSPINVTNLTLMQGFFTRLVQTGNMVAWTLTVEECVYLMLPLVFRLLVRFKSLVTIALWLLAWTFGMLLIGYLLVIWSNTTGIVKQAGFMETVNYMLYRTPFGYIFDFSVGTLVALFYRRRGSAGVAISTVLSAVGVLGIVGCQTLMSAFPGEYRVRLLMYAVAALGGLLIFALTCESTLLARVLSWEPLVYMGRISYALYLVQLTPLVAFMRPWSPILFYVGANVVSAALYQFIEKPANRLFSRPRQAIQQLIPVHNRS